MKALQDHPIAELFPLASEAELGEMVESIRERGQLDAIDVYEGKILDGRNRYRACQAAGVEPRLEEWQQNGWMPREYVVAKNLHRRHLTIAQRAALAVTLLPEQREKAKERKAEAGRSAAPGRPAKKDTPNAEGLSTGEAAATAAKLVGVGRTSVLAAELIARKSPETFKKMQRGEISVTAAATEAGVGTGTYTKKEPEQATPADNIHAAAFYTGMAVSVMHALDRIPDKDLGQCLVEATEAVERWSVIAESLRVEKARRG